MKTKALGKYLKIFLSFAIAVAILWWLFKDEDIAGLWEEAKNADFNWIILSVLMAILSHWIRAYRWKLFVAPLGYEISTFRAFLAVMIGYVSNLVLPRMGEVIKCGALNKLENVPVSKSLGTIITERILDLIILVLLICATILIEYERLKNFLGELFGPQIDSLSTNYTLLFGLLGISILGMLLMIWLYKNFRKFEKIPYLTKAFKFGRELWEGLTSVKKVKKQAAFWASTIAIWTLYYLMSYIVVFSIPSTSHLTPLAGLTILTMGSIGMAAPVQGGIGTYHFMISTILVLYGIELSDGKLFATILHAAQSFAVIIVGVISFFISGILQKQPKKAEESI